VVRHHVVQLARDPGALGEHGTPGLLELGELGLPGQVALGVTA
jgi:hypothetical protein